MKLSTKCRYGVRAMVEIARNCKDGPVKRNYISKAQGISNAYLENILTTLKTSGFIRTTRGANGGFVMDKEPSKINMYQLVTTLEGSITPVECLDNNSFCPKKKCVARNVWSKLYKAQKNVLESITLQDLLEMENEEDELTYSI